MLDVVLHDTTSQKTGTFSLRRAAEETGKGGCRKGPAHPSHKAHLLLKIAVELSINRNLRYEIDLPEIENIQYYAG